jgi:hypothetical protein
VAKANEATEMADYCERILSLIQVFWQSRIKKAEFRYVD